MRRESDVTIIGDLHLPWFIPPTGRDEVNNGVSVDSKTTPMPMSATLNNAIEKSVKWTKKYTYNAETCTFTESASGTNIVNTSKLPYIPTDVKSMIYKGSTNIAQAAKA